MQVERVQRWVMSALLLTVAAIFAGGLVVLAATSPAGSSSRPGLLAVAGATGVLAVAGVRVIHERSPVTAWLLLGLLPAGAGWVLLVR